MSKPFIPIFTPGNHTSMAGDDLSFSESDLAATVAAYDPALHEAPLVIGHPKHDDPAYGWVKSLNIVADGIEAIPHQVNADFAEMYADGAVKKVSASFYPPNSAANPVPGVYYLRHVAFLGAQPPAIKGLRPAEFAEEADDCITIEFSEQSEPAEQVATDPETTSDSKTTPDSKPKQEETTVSPEEAAALEAKNKELETQLDKERADRAKADAERNHEKNVAFAENLAAETRIGKDDVPVVAAALDVLQNNAEVNFGEGDDAKPLHQAFSDALAAMPTRVEFSEQATKEKAPKDGDQEDSDDSVQYAENMPKESIEMDKKIRAYMKKHSVDYVTAAHAVNNK